MRAIINWLFQPITVGSWVVRDSKLGIVTQVDTDSKTADVNWKADRFGELNYTSLVGVDSLTLVDADAIGRVQRGSFNEEKLRTRKIDTVIDRTQVL